MLRRSNGRQPSKHSSATMHHPSPGKLRQENHELKASLSYVRMIFLHLFFNVFIGRRVQKQKSENNLGELVLSWAMCAPEIISTFTC